MPNSQQPCVEYASIVWDDNGYPHSEAFEDVYYSKHNGLEESKYVFIEANHLSKRWSELSTEDEYTFVIAETGFGTGLNFLNAWQLWDTFANNHNCKLHFISIEKYPLKSEDLAKALQLWPSLSRYSKRLVEQSPLPLKGNHRVNLTNRVSLTLIYEDVVAALESNLFKTHCWFLDGFAPSKNPEMWNQKLYSLLAQRSFDQASISTFTAVGEVRRGLIAHGFEMKKSKGFGTKRDMLTGVYNISTIDQSNVKLEQRFDFSKPWLLDKNQTHPLKHDNTPLTVTVVGAGLAGCWTAHHLAERGAKVTLLDKGSSPGHAASGNPIGCLYVKPGVEYSNETKLSLLATEYAKQCLDKLQCLDKEHSSDKQHSSDKLQTSDTADRIWENCGVLQLLQSAKDHEYADRLITKNNYPETIVTRLSAHSVTTRAGIPIDHDALYFDMCGKAFPKRLCERLIQHKNISALLNTELLSAKYSDMNNRWSMKVSPKTEAVFETDVLILATANDTLAFKQTSHLPVKPIKGQITIARCDTNQTKLNTVICGDGYAAQDEQLGLCFGASFKLGENSDINTAEEQTTNLEKLDNISSALRENVESLHENLITNRSSTRTSSPDYQPIVGPIVDIEHLQKTFAKLRKDAKTIFSSTASYLPNLYVNTGHGSKGLTTTPIAAELLCDYIYGTPFALDNKLVETLHPTRFAIRAMIRNKE